MANDWFDSSSWPTLARLTLAKAEDINALDSALIAFGDKLPSKARLLEARVTYAGADTGLANAYVVTMPYTWTLTDGAHIRWRPQATNTGASTLNPSALGAIAVQNYAGAALTGGELAADIFVDCVYKASTNAFLIVNPIVAIGTVTVNNNSKATAADTTPSTLDNKIVVTALGGLKRTTLNSPGNASLTYETDITNATALTDSDPADSILVYDNSATALRKMTRGRASRRPTLTGLHLGLM